MLGVERYRFQTCKHTRCSKFWATRLCPDLASSGFGFIRIWLWPDLASSGFVFIRIGLWPDLALAGFGFGQIKLWLFPDLSFVLKVS